MYLILYLFFRVQRFATKNTLSDDDKQLTT